VAAFQGGLIYISECRKIGGASVHCVFRRPFQTAHRYIPTPCQPNRVASARRFRIGKSAARSRGGPLGRRRHPRSWHRQFVRRVSRQFFRPWRLAGIVERRRHLGPWISRRVFLRRLRRSPGLDGWIFLRIDRHFAAFVISSWWINRAAAAMFRPLRTARRVAAVNARGNSAADQQCIRREAPKIRREGSARPPRRRAGPACEWRHGATRVRRFRQSL
jgi:hypothetical protein